MTAVIINTGTIAKALAPGAEFFGQEYPMPEPQFGKVYRTQPTSRQYEEHTQLSNFGVMPAIPEGEPFVLAGQTQGPTTYSRPIRYGLGFRITYQAIKNNLYMDLMTKRLRALKWSQFRTKEQQGADVFNNGFTTHLTGDGVALFSASHVKIGSGSGTFSNILSTSSDLNEAALEDMIIMIELAEDSDGNILGLTAENLIFRTDNKFNAHRILQSTGRVATANNDTNALKDMGAIDGVISWKFLTDTDAWFVTTNSPDGPTYFEREPDGVFNDTPDFNTDAVSTKGTAWFVFNVIDPLSVFASAGI